MLRGLDTVSAVRQSALKQLNAEYVWRDGISKENTNIIFLDIIHRPIFI
jgi:hypothetical protein